MCGHSLLMASPLAEKEAGSSAESEDQEKGIGGGGEIGRCEIVPRRRGVDIQLAKVELLLNTSDYGFRVRQ